MLIRKFHVLSSISIGWLSALWYPCSQYTASSHRRDQPDYHVNLRSLYQFRNYIHNCVKNISILNHYVFTWHSPLYFDEFWLPTEGKYLWQHDPEKHRWTLHPEATRGVKAQVGNKGFSLLTTLFNFETFQVKLSLKFLLNQSVNVGLKYTLLK